MTIAVYIFSAIMIIGWFVAVITGIRNRRVLSAGFNKTAFMLILLGCVVVSTIVLVSGFEAPLIAIIVLIPSVLLLEAWAIGYIWIAPSDNQKEKYDTSHL